MILPFETKKRRRKNCEEKKLLPTYLIIKKYVFVCHMPKLKQKKTLITRHKPRIINKQLKLYVTQNFYSKKKKHSRNHHAQKEYFRVILSTN